ncbi:hypothetical protein CTA2_4111 [Colletotrichum tanaceti]|uniref:Uncharacterized protein n=1 Tax=Colletotrichum tanaceti TaxID=1306861 RepID=A0A4U6XSG1_9PEZI|nr:hypothetical protein CTA2_4122 [Colletotrichum tanaceti]KAJ0168603.1 hypothetical protein CTA2_4111 [Colletotrichum tanaceti]TKW58761.1 hypothetical protein CTA1_4498 [Colletotrichum tanaceti]
MSGMHSTFFSSVTGDNRHSYAVLSALQQGASTTGNGFCPSPYSKDADTASVSTFGSSISLIKEKLPSLSGASSASGSKKSSSLVARQQAAEDAKAQASRAQYAASLASSIRNDL